MVSSVVESIWDRAAGRSRPVFVGLSCFLKILEMANSGNDGEVVQLELDQQAGQPQDVLSHTMTWSRGQEQRSFMTQTRGLDSIRHHPKFQNLGLDL